MNKEPHDHMHPERQAEFAVPSAHAFSRRSPDRWLLSHVLLYWPLVVYIIPGTLLFIGLRSSIPLYIGRAFELVTQGGGADALERTALSILALALVQGVINLTTAWSNELLAQRIERDIREELMIALLSKSQTFHDMQRVGDIVARATNDVKHINLLISPAFNLLLQSLFSLIIPLIMMAGLHPQLLAAPLLFVILGGMGLRRYIATLGPLARRMRARFGAMNARLNESLGNIRLVRSCVREAGEKAAFVKEVDAFRDVFVEQGRVQGHYTPLLVLGVMTGAGLLHAMYLESAGRISFGDVVSYVGLLGVLRFPTFISIFSFSLIQAGRASAARILEVLNARTAIDRNEGGYSGVLQGALRFEGVSFRYDEGGPWILRDVSFSVPVGAKVAVVGPTGSGKSTLIKLLQRLYDVNEGRVLVDGVDVWEWNLDALRAQLGVIEQDTFLFSRTIGENIAFGCRGATRARIEAAAKAAQAHDFITAFEKGYDTPVGNRGVTLSGGQRQRIAIARVLLADPKMIALDDATSAVDSETEDRIERAIAALTARRTSLIITHRLAQIRHADLILVMRDGRLSAQGRHEALIRTCRDYRRVFEVYGARLPPLEGDCERKET